MGTDNAEAQVLQAEKARVAALVGKDRAALDRLLADDLVYLHSSGGVDGKASYLEKVSGGVLNYHRISTRNTSVRLYGDCAVVTGEADVDAARLFRIRFTNVWVNRGGAWRNVHYQATSLPA